MAELRPIAVSLLLIGLVAFGIVMFALRLEDLNSADQSIGQLPALNDFASQLNETLKKADTDNRGNEQAFENSSVQLTGGIPYLSTFTGTWKVFVAAPKAIFNLVTDFIFVVLFGGDETMAIVLLVIGSIVIITILLAALKAITQGESG